MTNRSQRSGHGSPRKRGVVGVVHEEGKLLVIRRSQYVSAPGRICFPGGAIEPGEFEDQAVVREFREEMGVDVAPLRQLWRRVTPWNVDLSWWHVHPQPQAQFIANPSEVAEFFWETPQNLIEHPDLLESNREFLTLLLGNQIVLFNS